MNQPIMTQQNPKTAIIHAAIFDGHELLAPQTVVFENGIISQLGGEVPADAHLVDGTGATLLPGLIDAHVHTSIEGLRDALQFGITTELEMAGGFTRKGRELQLTEFTNVADVRSAGLGLTAPGGHPDELLPEDDGIPDFILKQMESMTEEEKAEYLTLFEAHEEEENKTNYDVTTTDGAIRFIRDQIDNGADYVKIMIEEGTVMNASGLPMLREAVLRAAVEEAHRFGKMAIAHVLTAEAAQTAINVGIDGLAHVFIDRPDWTPALVKTIARRGIFVTPCLVLNSSIIGRNACHLAHDERVRPKLSADWVQTMCSCFNTFPKGNLHDSFRNVIDLHQAGVDVLAGTDVSYPIPTLGGLAHGVSVHHELQLLVEAGLSPIDALRAATSIPARRFSLTDRGTIRLNNRADLLLVKGNPTQTIADTLSIISVWKVGVSYDRQP